MKKIPRVLLVDDDGATNFLNKDLLLAYNLAEEVVSKTDGKYALEYLENECKRNGKFPDLILLDLRMPNISGFEFLQEFNKTCKNISHDIYVVILTISREADDIIQIKGLGNFDWIEKPLTVDKIMDIHHKYFRERVQHH